MILFQIVDLLQIEFCQTVIARFAVDDDPLVNALDPRVFLDPALHRADTEPQAEQHGTVYVPEVGNATGSLAAAPGGGILAALFGGFVPTAFGGLFSLAAFV